MTIHKINRLTAIESHGENLWDIDASKDHPACLRAVILRRPDAHPLWHDYLLSLVHLRPIDGKPAILECEDSSHEIVCAALDPEFDNQPTADGFKMLRPLNLVYQLRGLDDAQAKQVFTLYLQSLTVRLISPDTDYRTAQIATLNRIWEGVRSQH